MKKIQLIITLLFFATSLFAQTNMADTALIIKGATLPFFNILNSDSSVVSTAQIPNEKNVVLVLFNPSCGHCQTVGKQINDSINMFPNTHFIFVAGLPTYYLFKEFTDYTKIKKAATFL